MSKKFLEIKDVTFSIGGKKKVNDVNISIEEEGDIICILGPSGIGKTTMLRTIAGLEKINKGQIMLKDKVISSKEIHVEPEKRNIALSFQENSLFPHHTIEKNIYLGIGSNLGNKRENIEKAKFQLIKNNRITELMNILGEMNGKAIIWANYQRDVSQIIKAITDVYGPGSVVSYYGRTPQEERQKNIKKLIN